jgi:hypothetical protein
MKKTLLTTTALALLSAGVMAQNGTRLQVSPPIKKGTTATPAVGPVQLNTNNNRYVNRCGTQSPSTEWDAEFNKQVEKFKADREAELINGKTSALTFTLPVVFHVIHTGQAVGTFPNIADAQITSQITAMNQDYAGVGYKSTTYPATAFKAYAALTTNSVSAASLDGSSRVAIYNTGVSFMLATKDPSGNATNGIDRINATTKGWTNPNSASINTSSALMNLFDNTIKPGSIWDPTKYFNVWISDEYGMTTGTGPGLLGYSTFPASSTNTGLSAPYGTATDDGCWFYAQVCGSKNIYAAGTYDPTYCYGRTIAHECGHYLGLRHPWGDNGQCGGTDYCNDTPPEQGQTSSPPGCYYGTPTYPSQAGTCNYGGQTNTDGDMFMNIMDYTDDIAMYMFTHDQAVRMQTSLQNSPNRKNLTASAIAQGAGTMTAPVASFTFPSSICSNAAAVFSDASTGPPTSWAWSVSPSASVTVTTATSQNPSITFPAAGSYTVTLAATNTVGTNSTHSVVTVGSCTTSTCDTISNMTNTDTLLVYTATNGYVGGSSTLTTTTTTTYKATSIAEMYAKANFPTNITQITGATILFFRDVTNNIGTKGTSALTLKMTGTTTGTGGSIPNTTIAATQTLSLSSVVAAPQVTHVDYAANPAFNYGANYITPYTVMFSTPVSLTADFFLTLSLPTNSDTVVVLSNGGFGATATGAISLKASTGTVSTWYNESALFGNFSFAILPIACPTAGSGIEHNNLGNSINLFPNPNNGQFNFAVSLPEATNLNFTIVNMLGQVVYTKSENNITNAVLSCDLSHLAKGVYYANIVDGKNNKTVKKIIIE